MVGNRACQQYIPHVALSCLTGSSARQWHQSCTIQPPRTRTIFCPVRNRECLSRLWWSPPRKNHSKSERKTLAVGILSRFYASPGHSPTPTRPSLGCPREMIGQCFHTLTGSNGLLTRIDRLLCVFGGEEAPTAMPRSYLQGGYTRDHATLLPQPFVSPGIDHVGTGLINSTLRSSHKKS